MFCQKTLNTFNYKNKAGIGYTVLLPPTIVEYDGGVRIIERQPFHGINCSLERKLINHLSINATAHFTWGQQNGRTVMTSFPIRTNRWSQIDIGGRFYFLKKIQGVFIGGGLTSWRGNLFKIEDGKPLSNRIESQGSMSLGYSQLIKDKFFISLQGLTSYWVDNTFHPTVKDRLNWGRHTISLQMGLVF